MNSTDYEEDIDAAMKARIEEDIVEPVMTWYALAPSRDNEGVVQIEAPSFLEAKEIAEKWLGIAGIGFHSIGDTDTYHGSNLDRYYPHGVIGHATTDHMIWRKK